MNSACYGEKNPVTSEVAGMSQARPGWRRNTFLIEVIATRRAAFVAFSCSTCVAPGSSPLATDFHGIVSHG